MFQVEKPTHKRKTDVIRRRCHRCHGTGQCNCRVCGGSGRVPQSRNVFGEQQFARCSGCYGNRRTRCATCGGTGYTE